MLKSLLEFMTRKQRGRFVRLTVARSLAGFLDIIALALLWYTTTGAVTGSFSSLSVFGIQIVGSSKPTEWRVSVLALVVVLLFVTKGVFGLLLLSRLGKLTIEIEEEAARRVVRKTLLGIQPTNAKNRSDIVGTLHAIESGGQWSKGVVFGYSVAISESVLVLGLVIAMFVASPVMSLVLLVVLGGTAALLNIYLTRGIRRLSKIQMNSSKRMKSNLSAAVSTKLQLRLRGRVDEWEIGIAGGVRETSKASTSVYLRRSTPRYVMEVAILLSVAAVGAISLLAGELGNNLPGAAVILAGAFRITGALLPLQGAVNLVSNSNQLGKDFFEYVRGNGEIFDGNLELREKLSTAIRSFIAGDKRVLIVTGESGIGKSTSLSSLLLNSPQELGLPETTGYGGQRAYLLPGSSARNITLEFEPRAPKARNEALEQLILALSMEEPLARLDQLDETDLEVFSGGELTRLEILRAHAGSPSLVVLDEPSSGLDKNLLESLAEYMNSSASRYIVISHDKNFCSLLDESETFELRLD